MKQFEDKYKKKADSMGRLKYPSGGKDIYTLLEVIRQYDLLLDDISRKVSTDIQNMITVRRLMIK